MSVPSRLDGKIRQSLKVSVILATRNGFREIQRALKSVLNGSVVPDEIVVLDQSDDDRVRREVAVVQRSPGGDIVRFVASTRPSLCAHRNDAIQAATGDFIASIDDDVAVAPDWLERMLVEWVDVWERQDVLITGRILRPPEVAADDLITAINEAPTRTVHTGRPMIANVLIGAQFGAPKTLFERLSPMPFDERLGVGSRFMGSDDDEFAYRVMAAGCPIVYEPEIWCTHHTVRVSGWRRMTFTRAVGAGASMAKHFIGGDHAMLPILMRYVLVQWAKAIKALVVLKEPEGSSRVLASAGAMLGFGKWWLEHLVGRLEPETFRQPGATPDLGIFHGVPAAGRQDD